MMFTLFIEQTQFLFICRSAGQGINGDKAWKSFSKKYGTMNISEYCKQRIKKAKKPTFNLKNLI